MKITSLKTYFVNPNTAKNLLLCRIETDLGLYGWGEAYVAQGKERAVEQYILAIGEYMIGRSPFQIRHTTRVMFDDFAIRRGSADFYAAISAVEIAMWDIAGKACGQPVYNLIGGKFREHVRVYANGWYDVNFGGEDTPDGMAKRALRVKEMGFTAMKWDPFMRSPWRNVITKREEDLAVENVRAVREAVGDEVDLLIEVHRRLSPYYATRFYERIARFDPFWYEEPCLADNVDLLVEAKRNIKAPVVTGETKYTKAEFREVFEKRAAEIINPDICACGGISSLLELSAMAEPYGVLVSPHNYNSTVVGLAATGQASVAIPNFLIAEMFLNVKEVCDDILTEPLIVQDGFLELPDKPGLGIDIDMEKIKKYPFKAVKKEFPVKGVAFYTDEYPKKKDFIS